MYNIDNLKTFTAPERLTSPLYFINRTPAKKNYKNTQKGYTIYISVSEKRQIQEVVKNENHLKKWRKDLYNYFHTLIRPNKPYGILTSILFYWLRIVGDKKKSLNYGVIFFSFLIF